VQVGDQRVWIGDEARVHDDADRDGPRVAEDADAEPHTPRLRHPEHHAGDGHAGEPELRAWAGDVGEDHGRLGAEEPDPELLDRTRRPAEHAQRRVGHQRLRRSLEAVHPLLHGRDAGPRIADADGQPEHDQPEPIAEVRRCGTSSQIDGDHRADLQVVDVLPATRQVAADRTGGRRDEHVVDGGRHRARRALDVREGDRLRPGDRLLAAERALEQRPRIRGQHDDARQGLRAREDRRGSRSPRDRRHRGARPVAVADRQQDAEEREAVADGVMDAIEDRRSGRWSIDHVDAPQRTVAVEERAHRVSDEGAQRRVVGRRERDVLDVLSEIEVRHLLEVRWSRVQRGLDDPRPQPGQGGDACDQCVDALHAQPVGQLEHTVDDHRVRRVLHVQPGRVFTAEHVVPHGSSALQLPCRPTGALPGPSRAADAAMLENCSAAGRFIVRKKRSQVAAEPI